ncbi:MAG: septum site-determining protein minD [Hamadaea sp.]|uniref:septum site-determining protein Ssd n=1 Tax=Hamadaea sp. TaxID=2024425 RepID=UPI00182EC570|nr:septum site-determining protein Ssd [Hamadaea sp.]NUR70292.1 septum site-determining protein minD [Hamadaea sp.]NUT19382.1 septum site-determining protein minD [Hamadaea sp.]
MSSARTARPLLLSADAHLTDEILRLAAIAGVELELALEPSAVTGYGQAPLVLLGAEIADRARRLPRRTGVIVVGQGDRPQDLMAIAEELSAEFVACLPAAQEWLLSRLAESAVATGRQGRVIGVIGGRGGAGASTLAAALAVTGVRAGLSTLLVDADPLGGGIDLTLGWEDVAGLRWPALAGASGRIDPGVLRRALPGRGALAVLSWTRAEGWIGELTADLGSGRTGPAGWGSDVLATREWTLDDAWRLGAAPTPVNPAAEAMRAALDAGRSQADLVVLDLPRYADSAAEAGMATAYHIFVLVPAELRATAAALAVIRRVRDFCLDLRLVVRGPAPGGLRAEEIAGALSLPLAGVLTAAAEVARDLEKGVAPAGNGRGELASVCRKLLGGLA